MEIKRVIDHSGALAGATERGLAPYRDAPAATKRPEAGAAVN
jgi:hypothetical protein